MKANFSFWERQTFLDDYDVLIVGSGIVGLTTALFLKEKNAKWKIGVLERGFLPSGASTKNAGFACFGSLSELVENRRAIGEEALYDLVKKRWKGLLRLRQLLGDPTIDYQKHGGYELFRTEAEAAECMAQLAYFNDLIQDIVGDPHCFVPANERIDQFGFGETASLVYNRFEGQLDTGKMMAALVQKAVASGVQLLNQCKVTGFESGVQGITVHTVHGNFSCRKLALATNAFTNELVGGLDIVPGRGQVVVTTPVPGLKFQGTFHYEKGFYYFRNIGNRVLLGGGRNLDFAGEATTRMGVTQLIQSHLICMLQEVILPGRQFSIEQRWSGVMAFGSSLAPIIRPLSPNVFCGVRGSGMGVALGSQTGQELADMVAQSI